MAGPRQITEKEKQDVLARQGLRCFIDNHPVDSAVDLEFDHINPYSEGGPSTVDNGVCKKHNREKRTMTLGQYRDRLALKRFFDGANKRRLDDLLETRLGATHWGQPLTNEVDDNSIVIFTDPGTQTLPLLTCAATGERYFFASIPALFVRNDTELQPRPLEVDRLWELYRHLQTHTQLAPAVCRLVGKDVLLFDGQHKAAAQVWAGRTGSASSWPSARRPSRRSPGPR